MNAKEARRRRRQQTAPAKPKAEPMVPVRIHQSLIDRIDELRPTLLPREPYIRQILDEKVEEMEVQQAGEEE